MYSQFCILFFLQAELSKAALPSDQNISSNRSEEIFDSVC